MPSREITDSVLCPTCCSGGCRDYQYVSEEHVEECPNACAGDESNPCFAIYHDCPADCAGATIDLTATSREFPATCIEGKSPKASVMCSFDDLGYVDGGLSCDETASCQKCTVTGVVTPQVNFTNDGKLTLSVSAHGQNAYWGGPYKVTMSVEFYFE